MQLTNNEQKRALKFMQKWYHENVSRVATAHKKSPNEIIDASLSLINTNPADDQDHGDTYENGNLPYLIISCQLKNDSQISTSLHQTTMANGIVLLNT